MNATCPSCGLVSAYKPRMPGTCRNRKVCPGCGKRFVVGAKPEILKTREMRNLPPMPVQGEIEGVAKALKEMKSEIHGIWDLSQESVSVQEFGTRMEYHKKQLDRIESKVNSIEPVLSSLADVLDRIAKSMGA